MTQFIGITWDFGRPASTEHPEQDEARAVKAAEAILDAAGVDYTAAFEAFQVQAELSHDPDENDPQTALARIWSAAESAANVALTEGWHNPNDAFCSINPWKR